MNKLSINTSNQLSPISFDTNKDVYLCKKNLCDLDSSLLKYNSETNKKCELLTPMGVYPHLPYMAIKFDNNLSVMFNNINYRLKYIIILYDKSNKHTVLHEFINKKDVFPKTEILLLLASDSDILCMSVFADICESLSSGSDFFSQVFDVLNKDSQLNNQYVTIKQNKGNVKEISIRVQSNWSPDMLIPDNKTFYTYTGTLPFLIGDTEIDNKTCKWIIYDNHTTMLVGTYNMIKLILSIYNNNEKLSSIVSQQFNIIYKNIDNKYRETLDTSDVVVKCVRAGSCTEEVDKKTGKIISNKDDKHELNKDLSKCPNTISSGELTNIMKEMKDNSLEWIHKLIKIGVSAIIMTCLTYWLFKLFINWDNGIYIFGLKKILMGDSPKSGDDVIIDGPPQEIPGPPQDPPQETRGGDNVNNQEYFINQYNQLLH